MFKFINFIKALSKWHVNIYPWYCMGKLLITFSFFVFDIQGQKTPYNAANPHWTRWISLFPSRSRPFFRFDEQSLLIWQSPNWNTSGWLNVPKMKENLIWSHLLTKGSVDWYCNDMEQLCNCDVVIIYKMINEPTMLSLPIETYICLHYIRIFVNFHNVHKKT